MSRPIIQSLWIGEKLSTMEIMSINSFIKNGNEFHLYVYGNIPNVPKGTIIKDGNEILPANEIFIYNDELSKNLMGGGSVSAFSNLFRYKLLYEKGNYWSDLDMICLKYFDFNDEFVFSSEYDLDTNVIIINAGIIKCPINSDVMKYCYEKTQNTNKDNVIWGQIGPKLVKEAVLKHNLNNYVKSPLHFCPISYDQITRIVNDFSFNIPVETYCIHLWNECWRRNNIDKDTQHNKNSLYEILKTLYY